MGWPRLRLFEFNDHPAAPGWLRDTIVWSLSRTLEWGHVLDGLVEPLEAFLANAGTRRVLDLASGAGGPAQCLAKALQRRGAALTEFTLTDLTPHAAWWQTLAQQTPGLDFIDTSVDATALPTELGRGRACVVINALHHFPPELAQAVLCNAASQSQGIFIGEALVRNPLRFASLAPEGLLALLAAPLLWPGQRALRAALTWGTPLVIAASVWDGMVSALRMYSEAELRAFVAPLGPDWEWTSGEFSYGRLGRGSYFWGVRRTKGS